MTTPRSPSARRRLQQVLFEVDQEINHYRVEFERYFNGALDIPPIDQENALRRRLNELRSLAFTAVDSFRHSALEARFNSFQEMFGRRLREGELGLKKREVKEARVAPDFQTGLLVEGSLEKAVSESLLQRLFDQTNAPDAARFHRYVEEQLASVRKKTGCQHVRLRVVREGGKPRLKIKPVQ